jgi:hypothetical protein
LKQAAGKVPFWVSKPPQGIPRATETSRLDGKIPEEFTARAPKPRNMILTGWSHALPYCSGWHHAAYHQVHPLHCTSAWTSLGFSLDVALGDSRGIPYHARDKERISPPENRSYLALSLPPSPPGSEPKMRRSTMSVEIASLLPEASARVISDSQGRRARDSWWRRGRGSQVNWDRRKWSKSRSQP